MEKEKIATKPIETKEERTLTIKVTEQMISFDGSATINDLMNVVEVWINNIPEEIRKTVVIQFITKLFKDMESEAK